MNDGTKNQQLEKNTKGKIQKGSDCEFFDFIQSSVGFTSVLLLTPKDTNIEIVVTFNPWLSSHSLAIPVLP